MELDVLRHMAGARTVLGGDFPDEYVSALSMHNGALSKNGKSPVLNSIRNALAFPEVACQMRRLFGPRGSATRQNVLVAADMGTVAEEEDFEACAACRKAKKE